MIYDKIRKSRLVNAYYKAQNYIDIAWGEVTWFNEALIEMMAILYILEKVGLIITGIWVPVLLCSAFFISFIVGWLSKQIGVYDTAVYVDTDIDPVRRKEYEAALLIIEKFGKQK